MSGAILMTPSRPQSPLPWDTMAKLVPGSVNEFHVFSGDHLVAVTFTAQDSLLIVQAVNNFTPMLELISEIAGGDCAKYDKYLSPKACGECQSCEARNLLAKLEGGK